MNRTLSPLTDKNEIQVAFDALRKRLTETAIELERTIGWRPGTNTFTIHWHKQHRFWVLFNAQDFSKYWCAFGTADPNSDRSLSITCEINPPKQGFSRRNAGVFLRDNHSALYLAHSGKIGGGRKGIGKEAFLDQYTNELEEVTWPDGITSKLIILGKIDGKSFVQSIANFVKDVDSFKLEATHHAPTTITSRNPNLTFTPEFEGRTKYSLASNIEARRTHGTVVNTLHNKLKALGQESYSTEKIDLFLADGNSNITHLFEVKVDQKTTNLYQAVGQVMLHGALEKGDPRRILVLPGNVSPETAQRMKKLGITILRYEWKNKRPIFKNLEAVLN